MASENSTKAKLGKTMSFIRSTRTYKERLTPIWNMSRMCFGIKLSCSPLMTQCGAISPGFLLRSLKTLIEKLDSIEEELNEDSLNYN